MMHFTKLRVAAIALSLNAVALPASADGFQIVLRNQLPDPITQVYVNPREIENWGENLLIGRTIENGSRAEMYVPNSSASCTYDVWVQTADSSGATTDKTMVFNDCNLNDFTVN